MGSVNAKETNDTTISIPPSMMENGKLLQKKKYMSPLHRTALEDADPRSPGSRRTPVHSPLLTTLESKACRDRVLMRLGSAAKFTCIDPRSPASRRTPISTGSNAAKPTPPPFSLGVSLGDPRSPYMMRTPLAISSQEVAADDVVLAEEVVLHASGEVVDKAEKVEVVEQSTVVESTAGNTTREVFSSPEYSISPGIMALTISPLNSPALGQRKRKQDLVKDRYTALSPLKKSYSAPNDENIPPSPQRLYSITKARTPLSPLSQRVINTRYCMDVQPIKFRMDPGILG